MRRSASTALVEENESAKDHTTKRSRTDTYVSLRGKSAGRGMGCAGMTPDSRTAQDVCFLRLDIMKGELR